MVWGGRAGLALFLSFLSVGSHGSTPPEAGTDPIYHEAASVTHHPTPPPEDSPPAYLLSFSLLDNHAMRALQYLLPASAS